MADIFISYAKEDRARVAPLAKALADYGWTIWWDRTIPAGKTWREVIGKALESARSVVVVWSKASVKSRWVQEEADWGLERKILIPILLDDIRPPLGFGAVQAVDLVHWDPAQSSPDFEKLISDISIILGPSPKHVKEAEKAEEERKRKEAEEGAERARKAQVERKAEPPKTTPHRPKPPDASIDKTKLLEPEPPKPAAGIKKPSENSPATKIGVSIVLFGMIVAGMIFFFRQEPTKSEPEKKITNSIGMEFALIPAGSFTMGSSTGDEDERPLHNVKISQSFYLQTTEVTQGQWKKVMGDNPSRFKECGDDCPVEDVSWEDAKRFIDKLNQLEKTKDYRLPSEAEWEYACRAGTTTEFSFGDDTSKLGEYAWYVDNSSNTTQRVAGKKPNPWGLYDMHGNVWEWVYDYWHDSYKGAPADGNAWVDNPRGSVRVLRGGSWIVVARDCRSAARNFDGPDDRNSYVGFRLSRSVSHGP